MSYPVSLAGLPDLAKLLPADLQPAAQPATDFLAILDRALSDKTGDFKPAESSPYDINTRSTSSDKTSDFRTSSAATSDTATSGTPASRALPQQNDAPVQPAAQTTETDAAKAANKDRESVKAKEAKDIKEARELGSPYLRKHRERDDETVRHVVPHAEQKYQGGMESLGQAAARLVAETAQLKATENAPARSNKIEHKTAQSLTARDAQANQIAALKTKHEINRPQVQAADAKTLVASAQKKVPDWSALDGNVLGLKDAMSTVQNLAQRLGLGEANIANPAFAAKTGEQAAKISLVNNTLRVEKKTALDGADSAGDIRGKRLEQARTDRVRGRDLDLNRIEVSDLRGLAGKSSLVLENMVRENDGAKSSILVAAQQGQPQIKGDEAAAKREQLQLVNTAFFSPAGPVVQMPVTVVPSASGSYQQSIKQWLDRNGNNDIVQQAKIVLNGNDSGEIRLILKPENLGEVRINLQLEDGRIGGSIFVENKDVQSVFESNLDALRQAFEDGGLQTGNLQVNVDGKGSGSGGSFARKDNSDDEGRNRYAARKIESNIASVGSYNGDFERINLMA